MPPESLETSLILKPSGAADLREAAYASLERAGISLPAKKVSTKAIRAILHAASGIAVVPFHGVTPRGCTCGRPECNSPGKHAVINDWPKLATAELSTVVGWWQAHPLANIAGVVGTDILVLDVDARNGGLDSLDALVDLHGELPETPTSLTGGGGLHYLFRNTLPGSTKTKTGAQPGIDILVGDHAFILPGSTHTSGNRYEWASGFEFGGVELADPPPWLEELMLSGGPGEATPKQSLDGQVIEGHRNSHVFGVVSNLLKAHMSGDTLRRVASSYNQTVCHPPLAETELAQIVSSAESRQPSRPDEEPLTILSRKDLRDLPEPKFLVEGMLLEGSLNMIWGDSNVGKTFIALHLAACIATGTPLFGRDTVEGHVQYVIAEGKGGFNARVRAWEKFNGHKLDGKMSFIDRPVQLHDDRAIDRLIDASRNSAVAPSLVVIDTLARCLLGKDENSSKDAGLLIAGCQQLQTELGCAVLLLHHCGKGDKGTFRGSSAFEGALDTIMSVDRVPKEKSDVIFRCRKQREAPFFDSIRVERLEVLTSAAVRQPDGPTHFGDTSPHDEAIARELARIHAETSRPVSFTELLAASGVPRTTFGRRLKALEESGDIEKVPDGGYVPFGAGGQAAA